MREDFTYIENVDALWNWCEAQKAAAEVAVDTEFERRSTYYPELCLVQLATERSIALLDPIKCEDTTPLAEFLNSNKRIKVLHAARQDLEVMDLKGVDLGDTFLDTQVAAALVGEDEQIGYGELVKKLIKVDLDKNQQRANWKKRPLPKIQLEYAISDVLYLLPVFFALKKELTRLGRFGWLEEECAKLGKMVSNIKACDSWKRLKNITNLDDDSKRRAIALANWREEEAKTINIPRNWVLRDSEIKRIAVANPIKVSQFSDLFDERSRNWNKKARELICVLKESRDINLHIAKFRTRLSDLQKQKAKLLMEGSANVAEKLGIKPSVLMTVSDSKKLVRGERVAKYYSGWRATYLLKIFDRVGVG